MIRLGCHKNVQSPNRSSHVTSQYGMVSQTEVPNRILRHLIDRSDERKKNINRGSHFSIVVEVALVSLLITCFPPKQQSRRSSKRLVVAVILYTNTSS
jgi:hypothetical protein